MEEKQEKSGSTFDVSSLIGTLISNPDSLSKMSEILAKATSSMQSGESPPSEEISANSEADKTINDNFTQNSENSPPTFQNSDAGEIISKLPHILSKLSSVKAEDSIATKQQIALLLAIRPYLSDHRKELIDTFIKMNHLGAIFKNLA